MTRSRIPGCSGKLTDLGGIPMPGSAADFGKVIADETAKWEKVVHAANLVDQLTAALLRTLSS